MDWSGIEAAADAALQWGLSAVGVVGMAWLLVEVLMESYEWLRYALMTDGARAQEDADWRQDRGI